MSLDSLWPPASSRSSVSRYSGFTRLEAVAAWACLAVLLLLAMPTLAGRRGISEMPLCFGNQRHLLRAWQLYAEDNAGVVPGNYFGGDGLLSSYTNRNWAVGWFDNSTYHNDHTNLALLRDSQLGRYLDSLSVFRCPLDPSLHRGTSGVPRVRSLSMNGYVGPGANVYSLGYRKFGTVSSFIGPTPSRAFVFIEEREDSINDPTFLVDMDGFDPPAPGKNRILDFPADWHDGAGVLGFADGHVESWQWQDPRTRPPHRPAKLLTLGIGSPHNADVTRLHSASTRRRP